MSSVEILQVSGITSLKLGKKASNAGITEVIVSGSIGTVDLSKFNNSVTLAVDSGDVDVSLGNSESTVKISSTDWDSSDSISGGSAIDTLEVTDDDAAVVDSDFTNVSGIEKLVTSDGTNVLTLGTKADDSGLETVTGGTGNDTVNASAFAGQLTIDGGAGADVITTQSGAYNLSVDGGNDDTINVVSANLADSDVIAGGAGDDTIV